MEKGDEELPFFLCHPPSGVANIVDMWSGAKGASVTVWRSPQMCDKSGDRANLSPANDRAQ